MPVHNAMTGSELHETKGAAAAAQGFTLVANGVGQAVYQALLGNVVFVNQLSDLPTAAAGKITLAAATTYLFGDSINIGTDYLQFSAGTDISSHAAFTAVITYTGTAPMLQGADVNATLKDIGLNCPNSDLFSWVDTGGGGNSIVIVSDMFVIACQGVGTFDDINTLVINGATVIDCTTGVTFLGDSHQGTRLESFSMLSTSTSFIGIDLTGATLKTFFCEGLILTGGTGSIGLKGDAGSANITTGFIANISGVQFQGVTTPLSGISVDDFRFNFQGNGEVADTMPDALTAFVGNATATVLSVGVPTLVAGTWVEARSSQFTTTAGGRSTYLGERDLVTPIDISVVIDPASGTNKTVRAYVALNGAAVIASGIAVNVSSGDPKQISVPWQLKLSTGDFVEVFIENETDSVDATVIDATLRIR